MYVHVYNLWLYFRDAEVVYRFHLSTTSSIHVYIAEECFILQSIAFDFFFSFAKLASNDKVLEHVFEGKIISLLRDRFSCRIFHRHFHCWIPLRQVDLCLLRVESGVDVARKHQTDGPKPVRRSLVFTSIN